MKYRLLDFLVCPHCETPELSLEAFHIDRDLQPVEVVDGLLGCLHCDRVYPIVGGIPRMLPDSMDEHRAYLAGKHGLQSLGVPAFEDDISMFRKLHKATQMSFSFKWFRHEGSNHVENVEFFRDATNLAANDLEGKLTLDAGCGTGRFLEVAAGNGSEVVGLDLSRSVELAYRSTAYRSRTHFVQGDLMNPPLRRNAFDYVYSIGVLHHTPNTWNSFRSICRLLRPGGRISIWVYRTMQPEGNFAFHKRAFAAAADLVNDGFRAVSTRLPLYVLHLLCYGAVPIGWVRRRIGENKALKFTCWPILLLPFSTHAEWRVRLCDTFDWLAPRFQWKHSTEEVEEWFQLEGLQQVRSLNRAVSVAGTKEAVHEAPREDATQFKESSDYAA